MKPLALAVCPFNPSRAYNVPPERAAKTAMGTVVDIKYFAHLQGISFADERLPRLFNGAMVGRWLRRAGYRQCWRCGLWVCAGSRGHGCAG
jgi:hypothetical protein